MSTMQLRAFRPLGNNRTQSQAVTAANASVLINDTPLGTRAIRLVNAGADTIFIELSTGAGVAAAATSMPMLPNTTEVLTFARDLTHVNVVGLATGSTLYITTGEGL